MRDLLPFLILDLILIATIVMVTGRKLSFFHPLWFYLFFHVYSFTFRAYELYAGKFPMYFGMQTHRYYSAIRPEEFIRALLVADGALFLFAAASLFATWLPVKERQPRPYNDRLLVYVLAVLMTAGAVFLVVKRFEVQVSLQGLQLVGIGRVWPIACIALAVARWGFRWYWLALAAVYLGLVGTQGYHRFMAVLPLILLVAIYLARSGKKWPHPGGWAILIAAALIFPSLKTFGSTFQDRGFVAAVNTIGVNTEWETSDTKTRTEMFLDQFAGALSLADALDAPLLGETYVAVITLPVPRSLWPGKPSLGSAAIAVTAPGRPFDVEGRIVTIIGESYINFGYVGVALVMSILGFALTRFYLFAFSVPEVDPLKVAYLGLTTTYLQVFRDGIPSFVLFSLLAMFPIYFFALLNRYAQPSSFSSRGLPGRFTAEA